MEAITALEQTARSIKKKQDELSRKRRVVFQENTALLHDLSQEISLLDEKTRETKKRIKKLISQLRHVAKKEQLSVIDEKKEQLHTDRWLTKKELKKIISSSFLKEQ